MRKEAAEAAPNAGETPEKEPVAAAGEEVADEDDEGDGKGPKATPREVSDLLADPLRSTRPRYLPPGRYTVEIAVGAEKASTRLMVKAPKAQAAGGEED